MTVYSKLLLFLIKKLRTLVHVIFSLSNQFDKLAFFWKVANFSGQYWFTYNSKLNLLQFKSIKNL